MPALVQNRRKERRPHRSVHVEQQKTGKGQGCKGTDVKAPLFLLLPGGPKLFCLRQSVYIPGSIRPSRMVPDGGAGLCGNASKRTVHKRNTRLQSTLPFFFIGFPPFSVSLSFYGVFRFFIPRLFFFWIVFAKRIQSSLKRFKGKSGAFRSLSSFSLSFALGASRPSDGC